MVARVLEWNVAGLWGKATLQAEPILHFLLAAVHRLRLDGMVLVEVFDGDLREAILQTFRDGWEWAHHEKAAGVMVGFLGTIESSRSIDLRRCGGCCQFDCLVNKGALHCRGRLSRTGKSLDLVGVHLQSLDTCGVRPRQVRHLRGLVQEVGRPLWVAGERQGVYAL